LHSTPVSTACCLSYRLPSQACHPGLFVYDAGAYLLGVMPPELLQLLELDLPLRRRAPHYFLPTTGDK